MLNSGNRDDAVERELTALAEQARELTAELQVQADEISARENRGAPIKRLMKSHERLRDRYWAVETRCRQLQRLLPRRPPYNEDF